MSCTTEMLKLDQQMQHESLASMVISSYVYRVKIALFQKEDTVNNTRPTRQRKEGWTLQLPRMLARC